MKIHRCNVCSLFWVVAMLASGCQWSAPTHFPSDAEMDSNSRQAISHMVARTAAEEGPVHQVRSIITKHSPPIEITFVVRGRIIETTEQLRAYVGKMLPGQSLYWDSGCRDFHRMPLADAAIPISQFKNYCSERGIEFIHVVTGF